MPPTAKKKRTGTHKRQTPVVPDSWRANEKLVRYIARLGERGNIEDSLRAAGISRAWAWEKRKQDPEFQTAHEDALKCGLECLKDEAHRRAYAGTFKPVYHKGEHVGLVREYSDSLIMFLMKQHDPSYREHYNIDVGNKDARPFMFNMMLHPDAVKGGQ